MRYYIHFHTNEKVYEEEWKDYAMDKLGIKIEPKGKHGELTQDQVEFIDEFTSWYFSGNWVLEEEEQ